jgi:hypothetical protein
MPPSRPAYRMPSRGGISPALEAGPLPRSAASRTGDRTAAASGSRKSAGGAGEERGVVATRASELLGGGRDRDARPPLYEERSALAPERNATVHQEGGVKQRARESERVPRCCASGTRRVPLGVVGWALGSQSAARSGASLEVALLTGVRSRSAVGPRAGRSVNQTAASCLDEPKDGVANSLFTSQNARGIARVGRANGGSPRPSGAQRLRGDAEHSKAKGSCGRGRPPMSAPSMPVHDRPATTSG